MRAVIDSGLATAQSRRAVSLASQYVSLALSDGISPPYKLPSCQWPVAYRFFESRSFEAISSKAL